MKKSILFLMLLAPLAHAAPTTFYYSGTMYMNFVGNDDLKKSEYVLARTYDNEKNEIQETIISKPGDIPYGEAKTVMKVNGESVSYVGENVKGTGTLRGEPWKWTKMTADHSIESSTTSVRFVETVYLSDPQLLVRHVDVYRALDDGGPKVLAEQIDILVRRVPEYIYLVMREKLLGPP